MSGEAFRVNLRPCFGAIKKTLRERRVFSTKIPLYVSVKAEGLSILIEFQSEGMQRCGIDTA